MSTDQAWQEIEGLVEEIANLAQTDLPVRDFYAELLERAVRALAAVGGAVWICRDGRLQREFQIHFAKTGIDQSAENRAAHDALLQQVLQGEAIKAIPPRSGFGQAGQATNPTDFLLVLGPVQGEQETEAVIEIVQRPDAAPSAHRGYVQLVEVLCEVASQYHRRRQYRDLQDRQSLWGRFDQFAQRVHSNLQLDWTAYAIANEGRRAIGCDRVGLLVTRGKKCYAAAVSGMDRVNRRSNVVRLLERIGKTIMANDQPLWYTGDSSELPPQIDTPLQAYLDESHARTLAIVPLKTSTKEENDRQRSRTIGLLVAESFHGSDDEAFQQRVETVCRHASGALNNALILHHVPLRSVLLLLSRLTQWLRGRRLMLALLVLSVLAAAVTALFIIPADFKIEGRGELQPVTRRHVFAPRDGIVEHLDPEIVQRQTVEVTTDKVLIELQDNALQYESARVTGELETARQQLNTVNATRQIIAGDPEQRNQSNRLTAQEQELKVTIKGLEKQLSVISRQKAELKVHSAIKGQILTWNLSDLLQSRPVRRGQSLLTVADSQGPWELQVRVPEQHIGYVLDAQKKLDKKSGEKLHVTFLLKSNPKDSYRGTVEKIALVTETDDSGEATVRVTVQFDRDRLPRLRPGASVIAKIHCGQRPLGYVWLHDLIEAVRTRILF